MNPQPRVSIIVPSYNQGQFIAATLDSILQQNYRPLEIWVIDGASTDNTVDILKTYTQHPELHWLSEPDTGVVDAVNKGFARATGEIIGIQSSDDLYLPNALQTAVDAFQAHPEVGLVFGDIHKIDAAGNLLNQMVLPPFTLADWLSKHTWIPQPSAFFRRQLLNTTGGWRDSVPYAADTDLWLRMVFNTQAKKLDAYLAQRRVHEAQRDTQGEKIIRDYTRMIDDSAELKKAPQQLQNAAKAGVILHQNRYNTTLSANQRWQNLWHAAISYPPIFKRFPITAFLPSFFPTIKLRTLRATLGAYLYDWPRYRRTLANRTGWVTLGNRQDQLTTNPNGPGVRCAGRWSSDLHACHRIPSLGNKLLHRALQQWPVRWQTQAVPTNPPKISVLIPFAGQARLPLLYQTLASWLAQDGAAVECIVIEQSTHSVIDTLPTGVQHLHLPHPTQPNAWHKSWAFNVGARAANGAILVCHDADIPVPQHYAQEILTRCTQDVDVLHLQRFLFCLNAADTATLLANGQLPANARPERVRQNWQGGTLAIRQSAFFAIGGFDESFVGWGGEDNEFFDRCLTLNGWRYGYLPFLHLWHPPQAAKLNAAREHNLAFLRQRLAIPARQRIAELSSRTFGHA